MTEPTQVYVLTYESGEYSSWNLQVIRVYVNKEDADADCAALNAMEGVGSGYEVNAFSIAATRALALCPHCAAQYTQGTERLDSRHDWPNWRHFCPLCDLEVTPSIPMD